MQVKGKRLKTYHQRVPGKQISNHFFPIISFLFCNFNRLQEVRNLCNAAGGSEVWNPSSSSLPSSSPKRFQRVLFFYNQLNSGLTKAGSHSNPQKEMKKKERRLQRLAWMLQEGTFITTLRYFHTEKGEQRTTVKALLSGKDFFHHRWPLGHNACLMSPLAPKGSLELLPCGSTGSKSDGYVR